LISSQSKTERTKHKDMSEASELSSQKYFVVEYRVQGPFSFYVLGFFFFFMGFISLFLDIKLLFLLLDRRLLS
jgi:hypothetical protein